MKISKNNNGNGGCLIGCLGFLLLGAIGSLFSKNTDTIYAIVAVLLIIAIVYLVYKHFRPNLSDSEKALKEQLDDSIAKIRELEGKLEAFNSVPTEQIEAYTTEGKLIEKKNELDELVKEINEKKKLLNTINLDISFEEFGIYKPVYEFATSTEYKDRLDEIRKEQKNLVSNKEAVLANYNMSVDGDLKEGKKLVDENVKQILRSFNNECDVLIDKAKYSNVDSIKNKIMRSYDQLNKLNKRMNIQIKQEYLQLKLDELALAYEYLKKKEEEKEKAREERERLREEAKVQKEIEAVKKTIEKEKNHYSSALNDINNMLASDPDNKDYLNKKAEIEAQLDEIEKNLKDVDYREANTRAGYVYVISNIGSFGENIYKIGMTRRLDPYDRIRELGDASVPFNFDVHAMIFTDDAPALESALHRAFDDKKVNMINTRREFFNVTLEEIEDVVKKNFEKAVEFNKTADAEQYRESVAIKNKSII